MVIDPQIIQGWGRDLGVYDMMNLPLVWGFTESFHFLGLTLMLATVGLFDLRILGLARGISMATLHRLVPIGVGGFLLSIATGSLFILAMASQYVFNPAFQLKMLLIAIAGVNTAVFYAVAARKVDAAEPEAMAPAYARVIAGLSITLWIAIIVLGRVITMFRPPYYSCPWC